MTSPLVVAMVLGIGMIAAGVISVELGLAVAVLEILIGVAFGSTLHLPTPDWLAFLASFGSVVLTFNAGAEIDPDQLRRTWRASLLIGTVSFAAPFTAVLLVCHYVLAWNWAAALIGGIALSTTSVAVIWAVAVETGLTRTDVGQLVISATFVTDLLTVIALSVLFVTPTWWLAPFVVVSAMFIVVMRRLEGRFFSRYGNRVIETEIKGAFAALLVLMWLADKAHAEAVLPAFVLGFALTPAFARHPELRSRFRIVSFALLTPFFFLRAGLNVSLGLVIANLGLLVLLLVVKLVTKTVPIYPLACRYARRQAWPVALLMSTGLTFGTIASQAGLSMGVISQAQFSVLIGVVILSAVVPTAFAQRMLRGDIEIGDELPPAGKTVPDDDRRPRDRSPSRARLSSLRPQRRC